MKKLLSTFVVLASLTLSTTAALADGPEQQANGLSNGLNDGLDAPLTPAQLQQQAQIQATNKNQLSDLLRGVRSLLTPLAARDQLRNSMEQIVLTANSSPKETFIHYSLNRAMKLSDLLGSAGNNSFIEDLQKRLLWTSAETALKLADSDMSKAAEFGISNTEFILSWSDSILNSSVEYQIATQALIFLQNDLNRDTEHFAFAQEITDIDTFLSSQKIGKKKDSDYARAMPALRAAYAKVLGELKAMPRFATVIDDPENPGLDYYRRTLRENLSDSDLDTRLHAMKSLETLELKPNDEIRLAEMLGDSSYQMCSGAMLILKPVLQIAAGTESALYTAATSQTIRECKDAAVILLGRVRDSNSNAYLSNLYHSSCIGSDIALIVNYARELSTQAAQPDLLSQGTGLCIGTMCIGDWVAAKVSGGVIQGPITAIDHGRVMIGTQSGWINPKDVGRKTDCYQGVCTDETGMLKESGGHKTGSLFKRLGMSLPGVSLVGIATGYDGGNRDIAIYHTLLNVSAVFDNGLIFANEVNNGLLSSWITFDKFEKISDGLGEQKKCYVPVQ
jgi:hypothetical protein